MPISLEQVRFKYSLEGDNLADTMKVVPAEGCVSDNVSHMRSDFLHKTLAHF